MSEWKETTLGEVVNFTTGKLNSNAATINGKYPFFTCSPETLKIDNYAFDCNAILLAGNNANAIYSIKIYTGKFNAYQRTYVITLKDSLTSNLRYLYYLLTLKLNHFKEISQGSATKFLTIVILNSLQIKLPSFKEQKRIADVLSCLDAKIENLRRQNETLENIAQTLFKHWFIDFEFPNADGKPYKSSGGVMVPSELGDIPEGWRVGTVGEEFEIIMGQSPAGSSFNENKQGIIFFQGRTDFGFRFPTIRLYTTEPSRIAEKFDVLVSVRAPVGDVNLASEKCCIGRGLAAVKSQYKSYCLHKIKSFKKLFNVFESEGTVFGSINK